MFTYKIIGTLIQTMPPILIFLNNPIGGIVMILVTVSVQILLDVIIACRSKRTLKLEKIPVFEV